MAINLNTADAEELTKISGIGDKLAKEIVKFRNKNNGFTTWENLKEISGFNDTIIENFRAAGVKLGKDAAKAMGLNLNTSDVEELTNIPGIGDKLAEKVVRFRDETGGFTTWEDLKEIPGFHDSLIDNLKSAGVEISEEIKEMQKTAKNVTQKATENTVKQAERVAEYADNYSGISEDFLTQVRDSYLTSYKFSMSLMQNNLKMTSRYLEQYMSLQREVYKSLAEVNPFIPQSRIR